ncbi:MAG: hypothetical protein QG597_2125 [Actinomycetota bacterium]|nr:hypothetical protein [Actinomycetota bacterium]
MHRGDPSCWDLGVACETHEGSPLQGPGLDRLRVRDYHSDPGRPHLFTRRLQVSLGAPAALCLSHSDAWVTIVSIQELGHVTQYHV